MRAHRTASLAGALLVGALFSVPFIATGTLLGDSRLGTRVAWMSLVLVHMTWCIAESSTVHRHRTGTFTAPGRLPWLPHALSGAAVVVVAAALVDAALVDAALVDAALVDAGSRKSAIGVVAPRCAIGIFSCGLGVWLRLAAIRRLGPRFLDHVAIGTEHHAIERGGVFARLRHPGECGFLLVLLGTAILAGSAVAAILWLTLVVPLVLWRTRSEDRLLRDHFGDVAARYQRRVPALGIGRRRSASC